MCPNNDDTDPGSNLGAFSHAAGGGPSSTTPPPLPKRASNPSLSAAALSQSAERSGQLRVLQELIERESLHAHEAESKAKALQAQVGELEEERKDLARALAEVEGQYSQFKQSMEGELGSRKQMAEELENLKAELAQTQAQVAELAAERADMAGQLEAATEGYEGCMRETEQFAEENEILRSELEAYKSSFNQHQSHELHLMAAELKKFKERAETSESEQKWLEQNLERSETRLQELEAANVLLTKNKSAEQATFAERKALKSQLDAARAELSASKSRELSAEKAQEQWMMEHQRFLDLTARFSQERAMLEMRLKSMQRELEEAKSRLQGNSRFAQQTPGVSGETAQLRDTITLLKRRLMVAEAAAEAAAGLKSKVARLENMLRQGGR